jgi:hypothetical protein
MGGGAPPAAPAPPLTLPGPLQHSGCGPGAGGPAGAGPLAGRERRGEPGLLCVSRAPLKRRGLRGAPHCPDRLLCAAEPGGGRWGARRARSRPISGGGGRSADDPSCGPCPPRSTPPAPSKPDTNPHQTRPRGGEARGSPEPSAAPWEGACILAHVGCCPPRWRPQPSQPAGRVCRSCRSSCNGRASRHILPSQLRRSQHPPCRAALLRDSALAPSPPNLTAAAITSAPRCGRRLSLCLPRALPLSPVTRRLASTSTLVQQRSPHLQPPPPARPEIAISLPQTVTCRLRTPCNAAAQTSYRFPHTCIPSALPSNISIPRSPCHSSALPLQ